MEAEQTISEEALDLVRETLVGDLRDMGLGWIKTFAPWKALPEAQQKEIIESISNQAQAAVDKVVRIIAADGRDPIMAELESVQIKDGIKLVMKCLTTEHNLLMLGTRTGQSIMLVVADSDSYSGTRSDVHPDPDQRAMFDEGDGADA